MRLFLLLHNIRSTHNVGSLIRSADCLGASGVVCSGYTPYPKVENKQLLPHQSLRSIRYIHKTALGAEDAVNISYWPKAETAIAEFKNSGFLIVGLEQDAGARTLASFATDRDCLLLVGEEIDGISPDLLRSCDEIVDIPMHGVKQSLNVSVAGALAMYQLLA